MEQSMFVGRCIDTGPEGFWGIINDKCIRCMK